VNKNAVRRSREYEVLSALEAAPRTMPNSKGWLTPMFCGGTDASYHSRVLRRLVTRGLVQKKERGGWTKTSWRYRITAAGRKHHHALRLSLRYEALGAVVMAAHTNMDLLKRHLETEQFLQAELKKMATSATRARRNARRENLMRGIIAQSQKRCVKIKKMLTKQVDGLADLQKEMARGAAIHEV
jgi:hypothetical protein